MYQLSYGDSDVADLEKERKQIFEKVRRLWRSAGTGLLLCVGLTVYLFFEAEAGRVADKAWIWGIGATVLGGLVFLGFWITLSHQFQTKFVLKAMPLIVNDVWPDAKWEPNDCLNEEVLYDTEMISTGKRIDRYNGRDLFTGLWAGLPIEMSYVKAEDRRTRTKKGKVETYYVTLFSGIVLKAERLGHPGYTKLEYREPGWDLNIQLPGWFGGMSSRPEIQLETNDPVLGKRFTLESDEPEAGRALVTEELLVTLQKMKNAGTGHPIVVLTPLSLYVILKGEDFSLQPTYKKPIHQQATVSAQYQEFQYLLRVVELLAEEPLK